eukprot:6196617-Pleurochrysis_carterae.AAC.1
MPALAEQWLNASSGAFFNGILSSRCVKQNIDWRIGCKSGVRESRAPFRVVNCADSDTPSLAGTKICESVLSNLLGKQLGSFDRLTATVCVDRVRLAARTRGCESCFSQTLPQ